MMFLHYEACKLHREARNFHREPPKFRSEARGDRSEAPYFCKNVQGQSTDEQQELLLICDEIVTLHHNGL